MANFIPKIEYGVGPTTIEFEYPLLGRDPFEEEIKFKGKVDEIATGTTQTSFLANIAMKKLKFGNVNQTILDQLKTFFITHASRGNTFKFFPDKDEVDFIEVELDKSGRKFKPKGKNYKPSIDEFLYDIDLKIRRVL